MCRTFRRIRNIKYFIKMIKHVFADMDGTVVEHKLAIDPKVMEILNNSDKDVIIVSGQDMEHMDMQLGGLQCIKMAQSGNLSPKWYNLLSPVEYDEICEHIYHIKTIFPEYVDHTRDDHITNMGGQVIFSFRGKNASYENKMSFDLDRKKRKLVLKTVPFKNDKFNCSIGGTTCLEYTKKDFSKGANIERYIQVMGWNKDECIFFGDALQPGGNDHSVVGVIETVEVSGPKDLLIKFEEICKR